MHDYYLINIRNAYLLSTFTLNLIERLVQCYLATEGQVDELDITMLLTRVGRSFVS